ncbi:MAG TPA: hypothetical protein VH518_16705 [Tepidisphaeraceae bacterium]
MAKRVRSRPPPADRRPKNKLLASLPRADFTRLRPHLRTVPLAVKQILHPRNETIREVFFPNGGVASITAVMQDGAMVEIATIGDEGLIGINAFFGPALMTGASLAWSRCDAALAQASGQGSVGASTPGRSGGPASDATSVGRLRGAIPDRRAS